ncbi:hypothetical protein [Brevibacillus laterosporus]|uniref:hypothetical protein n=1 Tax=Brevibacillus laterosporus TaxID=1465 RepID=UPI003D20945E
MSEQHSIKNREEELRKDVHEGKITPNQAREELELLPERELAIFLPTSKEIEEMSIEDFGEWIEKASVELPHRVVERNPLYFFKKRISQLLNDGNLSEAEKEKNILKAIKYFRKDFNL